MEKAFENSKKHTDRFFTGKRSVSKTRLLAPPVHESHPIGMYKMRESHEIAFATPDITATSSTTRTKTVDIPNQGHADHLFIDCAMGASTTKDYITNLGVDLLEKLVWKIGSEKFCDYDNPRDIIIYGLWHVSSVKKIILLEAMGGLYDGTNDGSPAKTISIWIPTSFDRWLVKNATPLNLNQIKKVNQISVTFRINTSLLLSGGSGGSITSAVCRIEYISTNVEIKNKRVHTIDFVTLHSQSALADDTATDFDCKKFSGNLKECFMFFSTTANLALDFYLFSEIEKVVMYINGKNKTLWDSENVGLTKTLINSEYAPLVRDDLGATPDLVRGICYSVKLADHSKDFHSINNGGLHSNNVTEFKFNVTQQKASGAGKYTNLGILSCDIDYENGGIKKYFY